MAEKRVPMKKYKLMLPILALFTLILPGHFSFAAQTCHSIHQPLQLLSYNFRPLNSDRYIEALDFRAEVKDLDGKKVASSLQEALRQPQVKTLMEKFKGEPHQILLRAQLSAEEGGGFLKLVTLDDGFGNRAYNHVELVALLRANPQLANFLGMYRVEGYPSIVWVPDMTTINFRLNKMSQQFKQGTAVWRYGPAEGVVDTKPYLQLLADGKFPFSSEKDVNLSIHDSMHSVAFAVLNSTAGGRKVLEAAKSRNQAALRIYDKLIAANEIYMAETFLKEHVARISPDSMERTMLLTIILTGNFDYFSASEVRSSYLPRFYSLQNRNTTQKRVFELLKFFSRGGGTFAQALLQLVPPTSPNYSRVKEIFVSEIRNLKVVDEATLQQATAEVMEFIPKKIFSDVIPESENIRGNFFKVQPAELEPLLNAG